MKRKLFLLTICVAISAVVFSGCSKKGNSGGGGGDYGPHPRSAVPAELVGGYWQAGSFSMSQFSNYDGSYAGQAYEISVGYKFVNDKGDAEEYFYYTNTSYYCRYQVLGYRKGTVVFDQQNKTFKFYAASGNYRRYDDCGTGGGSDYGVKKTYGEDDLYPKYKPEYKNYSIVKENGKTIWRIPYDDGSSLEFTKLQDPK